MDIIVRTDVTEVSQNYDDGARLFTGLNLNEVKKAKQMFKDASDSVEFFPLQSNSQDKVYKLVRLKTKSELGIPIVNLVDDMNASFQKIEIAKTVGRNGANDFNFLPSVDLDILNSTEITYNFRVEIKACDYMSMYPQQWVNDEIINVYGKMLQLKASPVGNSISDVYNFMQELKIHVLDSFLLPIYKRDGFEKVTNWTGKEKRSFLNFENLKRNVTPIYLVILI